MKKITISQEEGELMKAKIRNVFNSQSEIKKNGKIEMLSASIQESDGISFLLKCSPGEKKERTRKISFRVHGLRTGGKSFTAFFTYHLIE